MNKLRRGTKYRELVRAHCLPYSYCATNMQKRLYILKYIINVIRDNGGKFLIKCRNSEDWKEVKDEKSLFQRISQALRDCMKNHKGPLVRNLTFLGVSENIGKAGVGPQSSEPSPDAGPPMHNIWIHKTTTAEVVQPPTLETGDSLGSAMRILEFLQDSPPTDNPTAADSQGAAKQVIEVGVAHDALIAAALAESEAKIAMIKNALLSGPIIDNTSSARVEQGLHSLNAAIGMLSRAVGIQEKCLEAFASV